MVVNSEHPSIAESEMDLRSGITIEVRDVQSQNTPLTIVVTEFGITIEVSDVQSENT